MNCAEKIADKRLNIGVVSAALCAGAVAEGMENACIKAAGPVVHEK